MLGGTLPALLLTPCRIATAADTLASPSRGKGHSFGESGGGHFEGHLHGNADHASAVPAASMGSRAGLSHALEVMVLLPDSTCRQELDLQLTRYKCSSAGEWLLESCVLTGNDWERAWHSWHDVYQDLCVQLL